MEDGVDCKFREKETALLAKLFRLCPTTPIHVYGQNAVGKSLVVKTFLRNNSAMVRFAMINCVEVCYSPALMYSEILAQLMPDEETPRCDHFGQFLNYLNEQFEPGGQQKVVIVFEHVERLRDLPTPTFAAFLRLPQLVSFRCCLVTISCLPWSKFQICPTGIPTCIPVFFANYSRDQLIELLSVNGDPAYSATLHRGYCHLVVDIFARVCKDLRELRFIVAQHFDTYVRPIKSGEVAENEVRKLYKNIEPHLKHALEVANLRESRVKYSQSDKSAITADTNPAPSEGLVKREIVELPYYSKFLLIAAYLASNNRPVHDRRLYVKSHGKVKRHKERTNKDTRKQIQRQLKGPRAFPLDRLTAIFYAIIDEEIFTPTSDLLSQISSLAALGFLSCVGNGDRLDQPKFKCCATLELVTVVAKNVKFDLKSYLLDLNYEVFV